LKAVCSQVSCEVSFTSGAGRGVGEGVGTPGVAVGVGGGGGGGGGVGVGVGTTVEYCTVCRKLGPASGARSDRVSEP
jgi:hypothetical protein